jgi:hypothetical protein
MNRSERIIELLGHWKIADDGDTSLDDFIDRKSARKPSKDLKKIHSAAGTETEDSETSIPSGAGGVNVYY